MRIALFTTASALAFGLMTGAAAAAETPPASGSQVQTLQEVVITAQKRTERLEDVPVAASVVSSAELTKTNSSDIADLNNLVPSVQLNGTIDGRVPMGMRGISTDSNEAAVGVPSGVAIMVDGVPVPSDAYSANDLDDVQSVEVLKGPQGTLGGRTAAAGLINIVTKGPTSIFQGSASAVFTGDGEERGRVFISGPITDKVEFSLGAWDGHVEYPIANISDDKKTSQNTDGVRGKLLFKPTNELDITLEARTSESTTHGFNFVYTYLTPGATLLFQGSPLTQSLLLNGVTANDHNLSLNSPVTTAGAAIRDFDASASISYRLGDGSVLSSTTAYLDEHQRNTQDLFDVDTLFFDYLTGGHVHFDDTQTQWENVRQVTEELKLVSPADRRLSYVVGAFFSDTVVDQTYVRDLPPAAINYTVRPDTATYDLYGRATWKVFDHTSLIAGLRYNWDVISYTDNQTIYVPQGAQHSSGVTREGTLVGDVTLQQKLTPNEMVYLTYNHGYSPSVYNTAIALGNNDPLTPVAKETVDDFELGSKGEYFGHRLVVNADLFLTNFNNYQIQVFKPLPGYVDPPLVLENGGARTKGAEVDTNWRATRNLKVNFSAAYIDARYTSYHDAPCYGNGLASGAVVTPSSCVTDPVSSELVQNATGKTMPNSPKFKFVLGADQRVPLTAVPFDLVLSGNYSYRTSAQMLPDQNPEAIQKAFGLLSLSATLESHDGRYSISAFGNNLLDHRYYTDVEDFWTGPWAGFNTVIAQPARDARRYFGVRLNAKF